MFVLFGKFDLGKKVMQLCSEILFISSYNTFNNVNVYTRFYYQFYCHNVVLLNRGRSSFLRSIIKAFARVFNNKISFILEFRE